jgi:dynein heavy chain
VRTEVLKYEKDEIRSSPDDGLYVHGLFLDGARWDKKMMKLMDSEPKVLFTGLPVVHITGVNDLEAKREKKDLYVAPVYKTAARNDIRFTMTVSMPSDKPPSFWTLRGVACVQSMN